MRANIFLSNSAAQTEQLGVRLASVLRGGEIITLTGQLGSGKTTLIKGLAKGLGVKAVINSPTYVLMKVYQTKHELIKQFVHVDCYRVPGLELEQIGLTDYLASTQTVVAIEWAEKIPRKLKTVISIEFRVGRETTTRIIRIKNSAPSNTKI